MLKKNPEATINDRNDLDSKDIETDVHTRLITELLEDLGTDVMTGLSSAKARELLDEFGRNALTPPKKTSELLKLGKCCCGGFSTLIWVWKY